MKKLTQLLAVISLLLMALPASSHDFVRNEAGLIADEGQSIGLAEFWHTRNNFIIELEVMESDWLITDIQVYVGLEPPPTKKGKPIPGQFPCLRDAILLSRAMVVCNSEDMIGETIYVAVHGDLLKVDPASGDFIEASDLWVYYEPTAEPFWGLNWGWYFTVELFAP